MEPSPPEMAQLPPVAPPPYGVTGRIAVSLEQMTRSGPAFAVAAGLMVKINGSLVTGPHGPVGSAVVAVIETGPLTDGSG